MTGAVGRCSPPHAFVPRGQSARVVDPQPGGPEPAGQRVCQVLGFENRRGRPRRKRRRSLLRGRQVKSREYGFPGLRKVLPSQTCDQPESALWAMSTDGLFRVYLFEAVRVRIEIVTEKPKALAGIAPCTLRSIQDLFVLPVTLGRLCRSCPGGRSSDDHSRGPYDCQLRFKVHDFISVRVGERCVTS